MNVCRSLGFPTPPLVFLDRGLLKVSIRVPAAVYLWPQKKSLKFLSGILTCFFLTQLGEF